MQSQERDLITGLFGRLQQFDAQPRDAEAEALIREQIARQPSASYLLVQTVLVQEHALKAAQERIAELEAKASAPAAAPSSFLGNAPRLGPWGAAPGAAPAAAPPAPPVAPKTRSPLQAAVAPQQGGGFLRTAMATAAGVAGGALLFEGIRSLMGGSPFGGQAMAQPAPVLGQDMQQASGGGGDANPVPADFRDDGNAYAGGGNDDYDTASYDDGSLDTSSDDDWA